MATNILMPALSPTMTEGTLARWLKKTGETVHLAILGHTSIIYINSLESKHAIRMTLEFGHFEIHEARDGEQGLSMARAIMPTVVLLDVMMPGLLDGYQVCQRIKEDPALSSIRVILLTARGQATDVEISANRILKMKRRLLQTLAKNTGHPYEKLVEDCDRDYWLDADEAKAYGIIDKII